MSGVDLDAYWHDLFGAALLGTDRRVPSDDPPGPIAELLVELPPPDTPTGLLDQVAAAVALRRAGVAPAAGTPALAPPPADPRPEVGAAARRRFDHVLEAWPVLEPEWLRTAVGNGWRLGPELTVRLLRRHRTDGLRPLVEAPAGPLAPWLVEHVPGLGAARGAAAARDPEPSLAGVPAELIAAAGAGGAAVVGALRTRFRSHRTTVADRAPLVAYVAQLPPATLPAVAAALADLHADAASTMLAAYLADLAATRDGLLHDLRPPEVPSADRQEAP